MQTDSEKKHVRNMQMGYNSDTHIHRLIKTGQVSLNIYNVFFPVKDGL